MSSKSIFQSLQRNFGEQFICTEFDEFQRVQTPYLYPDGEYIDLYWTSKNGSITVTDYAETTGWLNMHSVSGYLSSNQKFLIEDACVTHGVEFQQGMIQAQCNSVDDFASVFTRVAQAALRVSDLWFTFRKTDIKPSKAIADEVAECLEEWSIPHKRKIKHSGESERKWTIDFEINSELASSFVLILSSSSSGRTRVTEHVTAAWFDLKNSESWNNTNFISLFHDESDVWKIEDYKLLEPLSSVLKWSQREQFRSKLNEAA